jgi:MinD-like ATPase involved in chromosome partitioning or flagellar assembly
MSPDTPPQQAVTSEPSKGRVICFVSAKGGSGKTVLAVSTAYVLLKAGKKVVTIDCDFSTRGMSLFLLSSLIDTGSLDTPPISACLAELVLEGISPDVRPMVVQNEGLEFHVVVSNQKLREGGVPEDRFLGTRSDPGSTNFSFGVGDYYARLGKIIDVLSRKYDYVILDTRGGFDYTSAVPALLADYHVVVLEADEISVQQVNGLKTKLDEYAVQLEVGKKPRGFLVNKALYSPTDKLFVENVARTYGGNPIGTIPIDRLAIKAYQKKNFAIGASPESDFAHYSLDAIGRIIGDRKAWDPKHQEAYDELSHHVEAAWRRRQAIERVEAGYPYASIAFVLLALIVYFVGTRTDLPVRSWVFYALGTAFRAFSKLL